MEEKVYIEFDLGNEEMIRQAIREPLYEDFLVELVKHLTKVDGYDLLFEDDDMIIQVI